MGSMDLDGVRKYICLKCIVCVYKILVINILHLKKHILAQMGMLWTHMRLFSVFIYFPYYGYYIHIIIMCILIPLSDAAVVSLRVLYINVLLCILRKNLIFKHK